MWTRTKDWFKRNRTTIAISAGVLGAGYMVGQYVLNKITEVRQRMSDDRIAQENLRHRFKQNQQDCTYTVLALLPTATDNIIKSLPVEQITSELQQRRSEKLSKSVTSSEIAPSDPGAGVDDSESSAGKSMASSGFVHASQIAEASGEAPEAALAGPSKKRSKVQLWNDLKIASITRAITLIYTLSLLTLLTRIQLNLLGRKSYLSSVVLLASPPKNPADASSISLENHDDDNMDQDYGSDYETNRKYLTFSWWLLHRGWALLQRSVEAAVIDVFASVTARDEISFGKTAQLILEVRKRVEGADEEQRRNKKWLEYLLPDESEEETVLKESGVGQSSPSESPGVYSPSISQSLRRLLDETSDLVDSPTFTHVLTLLLDNAFSLLVDEKLATQAFKLPSQSQVSPHSLFSEMDSSSRIQELPPDYQAHDPKQVSTKLATVLAIMTRQAHAIGSGGDVMMASEMSGAAPPALDEANEYLKIMESVRDLEAFAAVIYSSNFEYEAIGAAEAIQDAAGARMVEAEQSGFEVAEESIVDIGKDIEAGFESVWGKAADAASSATGGIS